MIGKALSKLGDLATEKIDEAILGQKPSEGDIRQDERDRAGQATAAKGHAITLDTIAILNSNDVFFEMVAGKLTQDLTTSELQSINQWVNAQTAAASAAAPSGDALLLSLLEQWAYENAATAADPEQGVDRKQWEAANEKVFGTKTMPRKHFYLHQLRRELASKAAPTETVDGWIANPATSPSGADDLPLDGAGVIEFDHVPDRAAFADAMFEPWSVDNRIIRRGGGFGAMLQFEWHPAVRVGFENLGLMETTLGYTRWTVDVYGDVPEQTPETESPEAEPAAPGAP